MDERLQIRNGMENGEKIMSQINEQIARFNEHLFYSGLFVIVCVAMTTVLMPEDY